METYRISDDIKGKRGHFHDDWDEWIETSFQSKFHEGYYETSAERELRMIEEMREVDNIEKI
jgi:hypothetical protein